MTMFTKIEQQKTEMLAEIEGWSMKRLAHRPADGQWSTIEMLDHIVKVEAGILRAVQLGLQSPHRIGLPDRLKVFFLDQLFRSHSRVKVPSSAKEVLPGTNPDLKIILQQWTDTRKELAELLAVTPSSQLRAGVFRHPVAGWMSLPQVLSFFSVHILHHGYQLARLKHASRGL